MVTSLACIYIGQCIQTLEFKSLKRIDNIYWDIEDLKKVIQGGIYEIISDISLQNMKKTKIERVILMLLKEYIQKYYDRVYKEHMTKNIKVKTLGENHQREKYQSVFPPEKYTLYVNKTHKDYKSIHKEIEELLKNLEENEEYLCQEDISDKIPDRIYFDRHLFLPILLESDKHSADIYRISPTGLVKSEKTFIEGLKNYLRQKPEELAQSELYLLRNYPKHGIGFMLEWSEFYPDFILWLKDCNVQLICFIDPKGLIHSKLLDDQKVKFADDIKAIQQVLNRRLPQKQLVLESFILSNTKYENLIRGFSDPPSKEDFETKNVLFLDDYDWPSKFLNKLRESLNSFNHPAGR